MPNSPVSIRLPHSPGFTAWSHGWAYLDPFSEDGDYLRWAVRLPKAGPRHVSIRWSDTSDTIQVKIPGRKIGEADREYIRAKVRWMFRADEDFTEFWGLCSGPCRSSTMQVDEDRSTLAMLHGFRGCRQNDLHDQCPLAKYEKDGREPVPDVW